MALTKITPQMFDTSATAHDLNVDNGTFVVDGSASRVGIGTPTPNTLLDVNGALTAGSIAVDNITIDGTEIDLSSGDLLLDVAGNIKLDADDAGEVRLLDGGTQYLYLKKDNNTAVIENVISNGAIQFRGLDGSTPVSALTLDMSDEGTATFNHDVKLGDSSVLFIGAAPALSFYHAGNNSYVQNQTGALIHTTASFIVNNAANTENMLSAYEDGAVTLYYNHSAKLATATGGITVTGTIDSTGTMTAAAGSNSAALTSLGSVELVRGGGNPYIDFKTSTSEDYDCRIQQDTNGLKLITGGQGSTGTAVEIDSSKNTSFSGSVNLGATTDGSRRFKWYNDNYHSLYYDNNLLGSSSADVITYYQNFVFRHQDATNAVIIGGSSGTISCGDITSTGTVTVSGLAKTGSGSFDINAGSTFLQIRSSNSFIVKNLSNNPWIDASDSGVGLYSGAQKKLDIISTGVTLTAGNFLPTTDNAHDLGSTSKRWRNVYTTDLHLSNEGSKNDVDGTSGDWTIQEGDENLYIINNKSGKKYKFALEEIE